jgi:hypothetical protein
MNYSVGEDVLNTMFKEQEQILRDIDNLPVEREAEVFCYELGYKDTVSKTDILEEPERVILLRILDRKACVVEFKVDVKVVDIIPYLGLSDEMFKRCSKPRVTEF